MKRSNKLIAEAAAAAQIGKFDHAEKLYRKVLKRDPANLDGHHLLGALLAERRAYAEAQEHMLMAATLSPKSPYVWGNLGSLLRMMGDIGGAIEAWTRATKLDPGMVEAWFGIGQLHFGQGNLEDAEVCMRRVVAVKPLAQAWSTLALIADKKGMKDEAIARCQKTLEIQPGNGNALFLLSRLQDQPMDYPPNDAIRNLFDQYAVNFDQHLIETLHYTIPQQIAQILLSAAPERRFANAVDLGCGTGLVMQQLDCVDAATGVDLSGSMLNKARGKNLYAQLVESDVVEFLEATAVTYDLFLAAEVLIYMGRIDGLFQAAFSCAAPGALFIVSTETCGGDTWELRDSGRYAHAPVYVQREADAAGWRTDSQTETTLRLESGKPVLGNLFVFGKP